MKTILKLSLAFLILFALSIQSNAQNTLEIVIVGSSHDNAKSTENFQAVVDRLKNFKPDMVFGEYLPAGDYSQLKADHWAVKAFKNGQNYIEKRNPGLVKSLPAEIKKDRKALSSFPYYHKTRMELAVDYIKNSDRGNGEYQVFVLENYMKNSFGKEEAATYEKMFGNTDSLKKARLYRPGSEYSAIFFPLIYQLKQDQIYNMDNQTYDEPWSVAWGKADSLINVMAAKAKADSLSDEAKTIKAIEKYSSNSPEEKKLYNDSPYAGMNTARYAELDASWNFYGGPHFYGHPGFPTQAIKDMVAQWLLRNEAMCKNIISQAKAKGAGRVVVGVGASHRKWMEEILARTPGVKIINYNDLH